MADCTNLALGVLLHAYELRALSEEDTVRFETHLLACEHCFHELNGFKAEIALLTGNGGVKAMAGDASRERAVTEPSAGRLRSFLWPPVPFVFKPAVLYLLLLALAVPAYFGLARPPRSGIQVISQTLDFPQVRSCDRKLLHKSLGGEARMVFQFAQAEPGVEYRVTIASADGATGHGTRAIRFDSDGWGNLVLRLAEWQTGKYLLTVTDPRNDSPLRPQEYFFTIEE